MLLPFFCAKILIYARWDKNIKFLKKNVKMGQIWLRWGTKCDIISA